MHVPIEHHRRIVGGLLVLLFAVLGLLAALVIKFGFLYHPEKYLKSEEAVIIESADKGQTEVIVVPIEKVLFEYIEVADSCGPHYEGACLNVRSGPGEDFPKVAQLRKGVVLKVGGKVEHRGQTWYKIVFDEWLRYPERVKEDWYVSADFVRVLLDEGNLDLSDQVSGVNVQKIIVDRSEQMLYAYEGDELFMKEPISTGLELTPTPRGIFTIFKKTPSRYMQGPIPGITEKEYDLPGVPWNMYFTHQGAVIHGAFWHNNFGKPSSNGCVNLPTEKAHELYTWAQIGARVIVQD